MTAIHAAPLPRNPVVAALLARNQYYNMIGWLALVNSHRPAALREAREDAHYAVWRTVPNVPVGHADRVAYWLLQTETLVTTCRERGLSSGGIAIRNWS